MTELDLEGPDAGYGFGSGVLFTGAVLATLLDAVLGGAGVGIGVGVGLMAAGWWTIIYHRTRETTA